MYKCRLCRKEFTEEIGLLRHYDHSHRSVCSVDNLPFAIHDRCPACTCLLGPKHDFTVADMIAIDTDVGEKRVCRYCAAVWRRIQKKKKITWRHWISHPGIPGATLLRKDNV